MDKIKPCPFCGSENLSVKSWEGGGYIGYIICNNCEAYGPSATDEEKSIRMWNHAPRVGDNDCDYPNFTGGCHIFPGRNKEEPKMEKCCKNCVHISKEVDGKVYCTEEVDVDYSCKYWEQANPFESDPRLCWSCKYNYVDNECAMYCGREIGNPEGYVCDNWEAKKPEPAPLNSSKSSSLDELCLAEVEKWGATAQIYKTIEELSELITALARYQNADENSDDAILSAADNVREEREDVEIMLRQLDVIVLRSEKWRRNKCEHLQAIVKNKEE